MCHEYSLLHVLNNWTISSSEQLYQVNNYNGAKLVRITTKKRMTMRMMTRAVRMTMRRRKATIAVAIATAINRVRLLAGFRN